MSEINNSNNVDGRSEISVKDIFMKASYAWWRLKSKWRPLLLSTILGAVAGIGYSIFVKPEFTAVCTFVLDDGTKDGMMAQYAGLASLVGVDISNGSGLFKDDNIIELYRSRTMLEETLLTDADFNGRKQKLIDRYIDDNHLLKKWKEDDNIGNINFIGTPKKFDRKQDSIIIDIAEEFDKKYLDVSKPNKKLNIIKVAFTAKDEQFAKNFTDALVKNVNDFYVQGKTKRIFTNVQILQHQADSVKMSINTSISGVASAMDVSPNPNPALTSLRVPSMKKQIDVQAATAIYSEVLKNLETAKILLRQQTPLIQYVDQPMLPLAKAHVGMIKATVIGSISALVVTVAFITLSTMLKYLKSTLYN